MKLRYQILLSVLAMVLLVGCGEQARVEQAPPAEQKVVMVPSFKEGQQPKTPSNPAAAATSAPLAPGSTPDVPQPGDLDYKGPK